MSILITKNIFFFIILINFSYILCEEKKCSTIEHCLKCEKEDKCDRCQIGYIFNEDRKKCELKGKSNLIKRRRFSQKERDTSQETSVSSKKSTTSSKNEEVKPSKSNDSS